jgi:hypothetical protein
MSLKALAIICRLIYSLDVNMGQKILIRLRPAFDRGAFLQEEDLLGTMLHEVHRSCEMIN